MTAKELEEALEMGMDWSLREGYAWAEDKEHCEEYGRMLNADSSKVSTRAKKRGLPQLGTLGAGNHYCEIQVYQTGQSRVQRTMVAMHGVLWHGMPFAFLICKLVSRSSQAACPVTNETLNRW